MEKIRKSSGNVFIDLGFPPHEAAVMLLRAQLAEALRSWVEQNELTQAQAARKLGISQPRLSPGGLRPRTAHMHLLSPESCFFSLRPQHLALAFTSYSSPVTGHGTFGGKP